MRNALQDGAAKGAGRRRHEEERGDRTRPGRLPEHGDVVRVPAEAGDVLLHPAQRRELIEERTVVGRAGDPREALEPAAVVRAHHHRAGRGQGGAREVSIRGVAPEVSAAADPHHDRKSGSPRVWSPDGEVQPVPALGHQARLRWRWSEVACVSNSVPRLGRPRSSEPQPPDRWRGERDAAEHREAVLPASPHGPGGRAHGGAHWRHDRSGHRPNDVRGGDQVAERRGRSVLTPGRRGARPSPHARSGEARRRAARGTRARSPPARTERAAPRTSLPVRRTACRAGHPARA